MTEPTRPTSLADGEQVIWNRAVGVSIVKPNGWMAIDEQFFRSELAKHEFRHEVVEGLDVRAELQCPAVALALSEADETRLQPTVSVHAEEVTDEYSSPAAYQEHKIAWGAAVQFFDLSPVGRQVRIRHQAYEGSRALFTYTHLSTDEAPILCIAEDITLRVEETYLTLQCIRAAKGHAQHVLDGLQRARGSFRVVRPSPHA